MRGCPISIRSGTTTPRCISRASRRSIRSPDGRARSRRAALCRDHGQDRQPARRLEGSGRHRRAADRRAAISAVTLTDPENGLLNPLGVNCLRTFPVVGPVVWGARTLAGADALTSQWKYVPVRRTALLLEESLYRGTQWVVFEPNDERLWGQIRLNVGAFLRSLFRQGAFQGTSARDAYFVKCDSTPRHRTTSTAAWSTS